MAEFLQIAIGAVDARRIIREFQHLLDGGVQGGYAGGIGVAVDDLVQSHGLRAQFLGALLDQLIELNAPGPLATGPGGERQQGNRGQQAQ
jgi:hypothetical protein